MKYLILAVLLSIGCTVTEGEWSDCNLSCSPNEGVKHMSVNGYCRCNNGALFTNE